MYEESFDDFQLRRYREEKADGKGQHASSDRREDVSGQLRPDFRQEAVTEQGVTGAGTGAGSKLAFYVNGVEGAPLVLDTLCRPNAETPSIQIPLKPRYAVADGSATGHCCFEATVIDLTRAAYPVCECMDKEEAERICEALNRR